VQPPAPVSPDEPLAQALHALLSATVELVAPVRDRGSEVGAVRQLEGQDRRGMTSIQLLQLGHGATLPGQRAEAT
jgi:hypothetical protein